MVTTVTLRGVGGKLLTHAALPFCKMIESLKQVRSLTCISGHFTDSGDQFVQEVTSL